MPRYIGILGGMGPLATIRFYEAIVRECQVRYGAREQVEFPRMLITNTPVPDMIARNAPTDVRNEIRAKIIADLRRLDDCGVDLIAIPCNSVHVFFQDFQSVCRARLVSIVESTARAVAATGHSCVGLLATVATVTAGLYDEVLAHHRIRVVHPAAADQSVISDVILETIAGRAGSTQVQAVGDVVNGLVRSEGISAVVFGCTDLPVLLGTNTFAVPTFDSLSLYAAEVTAAAYGA